MEDALDELGQVLEKNEQNVRDRYWKGLGEESPKISDANAKSACKVQAEEDGPRLQIPKYASGNPLCRVS